MKNLLVSVPGQADSTSWYRAHGVFNAMRRHYTKLNVFDSEVWNWAVIGKADTVFMQRPFTERHLEAATMVKNQGVPLIVDMDDDLSCVPVDNMTHKLFSPPDVYKRVLKIMELADTVIVCSQVYKEKLEASGIKNVVLIPNAFDLEQFPYKEIAPRKKIIAWRGSGTHMKDVMVYAHEILRVAKDKRFDEWYWKFLGDSLWFLLELLPEGRASFQYETDVIKYHKTIVDLAPTAFIVPLNDSPFNRNKSNIAWLEATYAGAMALVPDWPQWKHDGTLNYTDRESFGHTLETIMSSDNYLETFVEVSRNTVKEKFNLIKWNDVRADILCELMKCTHKELGG